MLIPILKMRYCTVGHMYCTQYNTDDKVYLNIVMITVFFQDIPNLFLMIAESL